MGEKNLHMALKQWYARPGDLLEVNIDSHNIDILRGEQIIEIQTSNFSAIKPKLKFFLNRYSVRLVHPISEKKWIFISTRDDKTIFKTSWILQKTIKLLYDREFDFLPFIFLLGMRR